MKKIIKTFFEYLIAFVIAIVIYIILVNFVMIPAKVDGTSMWPTLHDGDYGFSFVISKNSGIKRFDIVIIDSEKIDHKLVKRVVGLPNEYLEYKDNKLYIDGEYVEEVFLPDGVQTNDFAIILGDDQYFVLGDNRSVSRDSRYYGTFTYKEIMATGFFGIYPFENFGNK